MIDMALLQTFLRYVLLFIFGFLSTKGWYDSSLVEPLVGAGLGLFAIIWFMVTRQPRKDSDSDVDPTP
jgi:hypothetical protein